MRFLTQAAFFAIILRFLSGQEKCYDSDGIPKKCVSNEKSLKRTG